MNVRKSGPGERAKPDPELRAREAAMALFETRAGRDLLALLAPGIHDTEGPTVEVEVQKGAYACFLDVEDCKDEKGELNRERLEALHGDKADAVLLMAQFVGDQVSRAKEATGRPVTIVPIGPRGGRPRPTPKKPPQDVDSLITSYASGTRFTPEELTTKQQGVRSLNAADLKRVRALLVLYLRDRGVSLAAIGAAMGGRKRQSIAELQQLGRRIVAERDADYIQFIKEGGK